MSRFVSLFHRADWNSLSISGRGTAREKHFKLLAFGLMFIGQVKRPIYLDLNGHLSSQKHRRFQTTCLQAKTDYSKYLSFYYILTASSDPGATSRDDAIFLGESLLQELKSPWELILTEPVPEEVEFRPADWAEKHFSAQITLSPPYTK